MPRPPYPPRLPPVLQGNPMDHPRDKVPPACPGFLQGPMPPQKCGRPRKTPTGRLVGVIQNRCFSWAESELGDRAPHSFPERGSHLVAEALSSSSFFYSFSHNNGSKLQVRIGRLFISFFGFRIWTFFPLFPFSFTQASFSSQQLCPFSCFLTVNFKKILETCMFLEQGLKKKKSKHPLFVQFGESKLWL